MMRKSRTLWASVGVTLFVALGSVSPSGALPQSLQRTDESAVQDVREGEELHREGSEDSLQKALQKFQDAARTFADVGNRPYEAYALNYLGRVHDGLGHEEEAVSAFNRALVLYRTTGDRSSQAAVLNNIGVAHARARHSQQALPMFEQALSVQRALGDRLGEAETLVSMGVVHSEIPDHRRALVFYSLALPMCRAVADRSCESRTLTHIGNLAAAVNTAGNGSAFAGRMQDALDSYDLALLARRQQGDRLEEALVLDRIGSVYARLGGWPRALDFFSQALKIQEGGVDPNGEAVTLNNIAGVHMELQDWEKAGPLLLRAGSLFIKLKNAREVIRNLNNLAGVMNQLGESEEALGYFMKALEHIGDDSPRLRASVTHNIGATYLDLRDYPRATEFVNKALQQYRSLGDRSSEARALVHLGTVERSEKRFEAARARFEEAIAIIDSLRRAVISTELRAAFFASVGDYFELYVDALMQLHRAKPNDGFDRIALEAIEAQHARSLLDLLSEAGANVRQGIDPTLLARERDLQGQLNRLADAKLQLLESPAPNDDLAAIDQQIRQVTIADDRLQTDIRRQSPHYAALQQPRPLKADQIQQLLDADTVLLEYSLGINGSYVWAVTRDTVRSYELPEQDIIEAKAREVVRNLTEPARTRRFVAQDKEAADLSALSDLVLGKVASALNKRRVVIVADGALSYVPFGALPTPGDRAAPTVTPRVPLVAEHEIVNLPSASVLGILRREAADRRPASKLIAVLADPVFAADDVRVTGTPGAAASPRSGSLRRLAHTLEEARAIAGLTQPDQRFVAVGADATLASVTGGALSQYRYVHFATHGLLDSEHPELSAIVLSLVDAKGAPVDGYLRLHDIYNLNLNADMVVLSACETGLGREIRGEGLVGITRGFMYAGAPRVVVSLWKVEDAATAALMTVFYEGILNKGLKPAAALRAAQIEISQRPGWRHPYFWAAFTLQGEWN